MNGLRHYISFPDVKPEKEQGAAGLFPTIPFMESLLMFQPDFGNPLMISKIVHFQEQEQVIQNIPGCLAGSPTITIYTEAIKEIRDQDRILFGGKIQAFLPKFLSSEILFPGHLR
jgi:hypothetical protein